MDIFKGWDVEEINNILKYLNFYQYQKTFLLFPPPKQLFSHWLLKYQGKYLYLKGTDQVNSFFKIFSRYLD